MIARDIEVARPDAALPGVVSLPDGRDVPGVVIAHEILGLTPHIRALVDRFAVAGVAALAVNLFARERGVPEEGAPLEDVQRFAWALPDARVVADLCAAGEALARFDGVDPARLALVGFSYGGTSSLHVAATASPYRAIVAFYPKTLYARTTPERPRSPVERVADMRVPLQAHFGGADRAIPPEEVERFRSVILAHDPRHEVHVYAGARHGFFNETRPRTYDPPAAALAWSRLRAFCTTHTGRR